MDDQGHPGSKPPSRREDALAVLKRLRDAGHIAYFAGGCVRDLLMGLDAKDYDIATDALPEQVRKLFSHTEAVGAAFGVILVHHAGSVIEVATFRAERGYHDGRRPSQIRFTTAEEDAKRRDFTINGLFHDPLENRVIDHVGGQADIQGRVLRAIGDPDERFEEDHLRLLRAVRFASRFALQIDPTTATAIQKHAGHLPRISPERIAEELRLMLTPATRTGAWRLLWELHLIEPIFRFMPAVATPAKLDHPFIFDSIAPRRPIPFELALAGAALCYRWRSAGANLDPATFLVHDEVRAMSRAVRQALRTSNEENDQAEDILRGLGPLLMAAAPAVATLKRFLAGPTSDSARALLEAIADVGWHRERIAWLRERLTELQRTEVAPLPLITGDDLTAAGLAPGPIFKRILDRVYDAQLEGYISTRDEALSRALSIAAEEQARDA